MARIEDKILRRYLVGILFNLLRDESRPEILGNIQFIIVDDMFQLANTDIEGNKHVIRFSHKLRKMIPTKRGLAITYAIFAHEIGHIIYHFNLEQIPTTAPPLDFYLEAERGADRIAIEILKKIYPENAAEVLLTQAKHALRRSIKNRNASKEDITLATLFFKVREDVLLRAA